MCEGYCVVRSRNCTGAMCVVPPIGEGSSVTASMKDLQTLDSANFLQIDRFEDWRTIQMASEHRANCRIVTAPLVINNVIPLGTCVAIHQNTKTTFFFLFQTPFTCFPLIPYLPHRRPGPGDEWAAVRYAGHGGCAVAEWVSWRDAVRTRTHGPKQGTQRNPE